MIRQRYMFTAPFYARAPTRLVITFDDDVIMNLITYFASFRFLIYYHAGHFHFIEELVTSSCRRERFIDYLLICLWLRDFYHSPLSRALLNSCRLRTTTMSLARAGKLTDI